MQKKFKGVLFDLDGTLVDTSGDLAQALNVVLISENKAPLPTPVIREVCSDGVKGLLQLGFSMDKNHPDYYFFRDKMVHYYFNHIHEKSFLFEGMNDVLVNLEENKIPWGIVTNKPSHLTKKLLDKLNLTQRASCVVSGDTLPQQKPDPAPLLYAAKLLNVDALDCCYVGDAERDIQAARAANMYSIAALYGFLHANMNPKSWGANEYIQTPGELLKFL